MTPIRRFARTLLGPASMDESDVVYRFLKRSPPGVILEVGAHYGDGPLKSFASSGWDVHAFEPDPHNRAHLEASTAHFSNVTVIPKAVSDEPGKLTLYTSPESTGISSLSAFTDQHEPGEEVEVITLSQYLATGPDSVSFLKVDVEGHERFVLDGFPWDTHRPDTILLEFEDFKTRPLGYSWIDLAEFLTDRGYEVLVSEWFPIEQYGSEHRWRRFARFPTTLVDDRAWGNLIATTGRFSVLERTARVAVARLKLRNALLLKFNTRQTQES